MTEESRNQNITLESRKKLHLTGVKEVESFDDNSITLTTELGVLSVKGNEIKIEMLNLDMGEVSAAGEFYSLEYISDDTARHGIFSRMFR